MKANTRCASLARPGCVEMVVKITNYQSAIRFSRAVRDMQRLAEDSPWMTEIGEIADTLAGLLEELTIVAS